VVDGDAWEAVVTELVSVLIVFEPVLIAEAVVVLEPVGLLPVGLEPVGLLPVGLEPVGWLPVGLEPVGLLPVGLEPVGLFPDVIGMDPVIGLEPVVPVVGMDAVVPVVIGWEPVVPVVGMEAVVPVVPVVPVVTIGLESAGQLCKLEANINGETLVASAESCRVRRLTT